MVFKVIVAGSRDFTDYQLLEQKLNYYFSKRKVQDILIISGMARGTDKLAVKYAIKNSVSHHPMPALWDMFGKRAGYLRNECMADMADALIAFWDGVSKGTKHMIDAALERGIPVRVVKI